MPLTRCSSASWSTSGLSVLPGGRRCGSSGLALGGGLLAGGVRGVALGRRVLGATVLGPGVLGSAVLGRTVLGGGSAVLSRAVLGRPATGGLVGRTGRLARLAPVGFARRRLAVAGLGAACLGVAALDL